MKSILLQLMLLVFTGCTALTAPCHGVVQVGMDRLLRGPDLARLRGKRVGLITNHTAVDGALESSIDLLKQNQDRGSYRVAALFAPEHGLTGADHAGDKVDHTHDPDGIPIYSLHGATRRPTKEMLSKVDLLIYDIQDIGSRSYTYTTTLFYVMEEAAKYGVPVIVTDRPNPMGGLVVDGPMLDKGRRSFLGYINVPYCHGMTVGELAQFFNSEYRVGCDVHVVPMAGWRRDMTFAQTGLPWIPTSPNIPESDTPFYYPTTGILGELGIVNIGVGYTLPFKVIGAPWLDAHEFAAALNKQDFPGVRFQPFHFKPFFGKYAKQHCHGVLIVVTDAKRFLPVSTQYLIIGMLKSLYPTQFDRALRKSHDDRETFSKVSGTDAVFNIMEKEQYIVWKLRAIHENERKEFGERRRRYLISSY